MGDVDTAVANMSGETSSERISDSMDLLALQTMLSQGMLNRAGNRMGSAATGLQYLARHSLARVLRANGGNAGAHLLLLDVRQPYEFDGGHIRGAELVDFRDGDFGRMLIRRLNRRWKPASPQYTAAAVTSPLAAVIIYCEFGGKGLQKPGKRLTTGQRPLCLQS